MIFLTQEQLLELHSANIARFGGSPGIRDMGAFESAVHAAEARNYYEDADVVTCAATYAYHLCQAHAFVDGNKRVAAGAALVFLDLNGVHLDATDGDLIDLFLRLASGEVSRENLEEFSRARTCF